MSNKRFREGFLKTFTNFETFGRKHRYRFCFIFPFLEPPYPIPSLGSSLYVILMNKPFLKKGSRYRYTDKI